jgi:predicted MFS family arabinose efflux permease
MIESLSPQLILLAGNADLGISLAARATPKGCEGLGYSLMLSVFTVAMYGADVVGSYLADHKWPFANLVYLNAGTTAIVLLLLPFLPAALMRGKDTPPDGTSTAKG